jgi:YD repeat-containing protein
MALVLLAALPAVAISVQHTYSYDALGRLVQASDGSVHSTFFYDADGNMISRVVAVPEPHTPWLIPGVLALLAWGERRRR